MKRALVIVVLAFLVPTIAQAATTAKTKGIYAHRFQHGKKVRDLQWLLTGHRPSVFKIAAYRGRLTGVYDLKTTHAVRNMKYRLGYPSYNIKGAIVGNYFIALMTGQVTRPRAYFVRATKRLAYLKQIAAQKAKSSCARNIITIMRAEIGVHEIPMGSNNGPFVSPGPPHGVRNYQAVTGAYYAPWCVSFAQWVFRSASVRSPKAWHGPIANNSAGAFYVAGWARLHGWARSVPKPAYGVVFLDRLGHMGIVENVSTNGFTSVEGNASNQVLERFHPFGQRPVLFVAVPGCDTG